MNEEPKPLRYLKEALRYLKGASTKGTLSLCRRGNGGGGGVNEEPKPP